MSGEGRERKDDFRWLCGMDVRYGDEDEMEREKRER